MRSVAAFLKKFIDADSSWPVRLLLCLAVLLAYASVWPNEFIFDDIGNIVENVFLNHWDNISSFLKSQNLAYGAYAGTFYRPVPMLLYFLIYQLFGLSTVAFHGLNVALQALNACLLHHFGIRAGFKKGAVFAAALLWAVHPLYSEEVAYMSATPELLWSAFCLLGLIVLLPDFTPRKVWLAMILFILALGSKGSAIVFPALAVITLFFVNNDRSQFTLYLKTWPLWLLAAGYIIFWMIFIHATGFTMDRAGNAEFFQQYTSNITHRILTSLATLPVYARLVVWPEGLHMERNFPIFASLLWQPAAGALMVGLCLLQIFRRGGLALSFGLLWFAAALSPATGIVFPINALISEGWLYMPLMGLFLGVAETVAGAFEKRLYAAQILISVLVLSLGTMTFFQNQKLLNAETLYQNVVENGGNASRVTFQLGTYYLEQGEFDKAIALAQYEFSHPDGRRADLWVEPHMLQALALLRIQPDADGKLSSVDDMLRFIRTSTHIPEAISELGKTLQIDPNYSLAHQYLSIIYRYQGNNVMADFHDRKIKEILQRQRNPGQ